MIFLVLYEALKALGPADSSECNVQAATQLGRITLLNAVTQLVRVGGAKNVHVFVTHAVMSQMPQDLFCCPELIRWEEVVVIN